MNNNNEQHILQVEHLQKNYGDHKVLRDISFNINQGEIMTIIGPSGGGKSTMLRCINLLEEPTGGKILFHGNNILDPKFDLNTYRSKVGMVFQQFNLFNNKNVLQNCMIGQEMVLGRSKSEAKETAIKNLKKVGMDSFIDAKPSQLSGGQQQRVAIARALVNEPQVLLLDESLSALDKRLRKDMQFELREIQKKLGITFIFVTHDQEEALAMSDEIFVLNEGKIQQSGSPVDIYDEPVNDFVARFIGDSNILTGRMIKDYEVEFGNHRFECADAGIKPGEKVEVVLRPEDLDIVDIKDGKLRVHVESQLFLGDHFEIKAKDSDENEWLIHSTNSTEIGKEIGLFFDPEDIHVMRFGESEAEFDRRLEAYEGDEDQEDEEK